MADLLDTLGKKETKTDTLIGAGATSDSLARGDSLIEVTTTDTEVKVANPDSWTKESALKEVTKAREEAKAYRLKYQESMSKLEADKEAEIAKIKLEAESGQEAKRKLEAMEADALDKKRNMEEKLADRESRLAKTEEVHKHELAATKAQAESYKAKALQYEAEQEARQSVYKERIKEELNKIPDDLRPFAEKMVKGYEDSQEAWLALAEAQQKNMFGEKKVVVNHTTPGAGNGARINKTELEEAQKQERANKTSQQLIRDGLKKIKNGEANNAYRNR